MKRLLICICIMFAFLLSSCGVNSANSNASDVNNDEVSKQVAEVQEDDFIYRLVSEKSRYDAGEPVTIYAELEYIGDKNTVEIFHAASPFYFPIYENSRDIHIQYNMNEPLVSTMLTKVEPLRETYKGSGSYGSSDSKEHADFMKSIMNNQFPIGHYEVNGFADFFIQETDLTKKDYELKATIDFEVKDTNE